MNEVEPLWISDPVAANVRAELARKGVSVNRLQYLVGGTQSYWQRRTGGRIEFSHKDLIALADLLGVEAGAFFVGATGNAKSGRTEGGSFDPTAVRRQGLEPRTRYISASASEDGIARIVRDDVDQVELTGCEPIPPADVIQLSIRHAL